MTMFNALGQLERGMDGQPYNLPFEQFELMYVMMARLKEMFEPWQKAREQRMKVMAGKAPLKKTAQGMVIDDNETMLAFGFEEQRMMEEEVRVPGFPKKRLELATDKNKYPPALLVNLQGLWKDDVTAKFEVEDDEPEPRHGIHDVMQAAE
jgi:hypothetical protein